MRDFHDFVLIFIRFTEEIDKDGPRACIRVRAPPGGKSSGLW